MSWPQPNEPFCLLEGSFASGPELYREPIRFIRADDARGVVSALAAIDAAVRQGHWVAGFLAYELGYALEPRLKPLMPDGRAAALLLMGVFGAPNGEELAVHPGLAKPPGRLEPNVSTDAYRDGVARILDYIRAGDVYQVNYTHALAFERPADPLALYAALKANQPVPYPAALHLDGTTILSLSPELFFRVEGERITAGPMKGTAARARFLDEDARAARALQRDEKNRAENLMIVDLMRNDLSRIAKIGSVRVPALFTVETYRTLHTLTSTIEAELRPDTRPSDILKALFPCGSVTGAPKIRAMEIIRELEASPRGVYTGAIGVFRPDGSACFNVAIRTLTIPAKGPASIGVGGGIVADSNAHEEAAETRLKAQFLSGLPVRPADQAPLHLFETMRWSPADGYELLKEHLERLAESAAYFGFEFSLARVTSALDACAHDYSKAMRVRLALGEDSKITITAAPLGASEALWRYLVSDTRIQSTDPYRGHKTSRRAVYDEELARLARETGCDEVLYLNERGELAEGGRSNVFLERTGRLLTPPLSSGALPGTLRAALLAAGKAEEKTLVAADLTTADAVYFGNSVRGLVRAEPVSLLQKQTIPSA